MAGAAGGFVTRAYESMLKECSAKKLTSLQSAIQSYLDGLKEGNQPTHAEEKPQVAPETAEAQKSEHSPDEGVDNEKAKNEESQGNTSEAEERAETTTRMNISIATALSNAGQTLDGPQAELVLNPLRLAFETKNTKIVELALDCLHKLIAYDHLEGDPGIDGGKNAPLFADILNIVCSCVDNSSLDSTVLQVLKVLLTAVASAKFRVHGEPLLGVIRVCYNIALNSKSPVNQATSKAMLTQMISIIFRRMESDPSIIHVPKEVQECGPSGSEMQTDESTSSSKASKEASSTDDQNEKEMTLGDALSQNPVKDESIASTEEFQNLVGGADIKGLEAMLDKAVHLEDRNKTKHRMDLESMSIRHRDALLLFRTVCKMGMKEDTDDIATKTRVLSLELLQVILISLLEMAKIFLTMTMTSCMIATMWIWMIPMMMPMLKTPMATSLNNKILRWLCKGMKLFEIRIGSILSCI